MPWKAGESLLPAKSSANLISSSRLNALESGRVIVTPWINNHINLLQYGCLNALESGRVIVTNDPLNLAAPLFVIVSMPWKAGESLLLLFAIELLGNTIFCLNALESGRVIVTP